MNYLTKKQIVNINRLTVKEHGGNYLPPSNFLHEENLDYLLEAVHSEMFGAQLYPTIAEKSALYMYNVIGNHIFSDGNKRTGLAAALTFLRMNGYRIQEKGGNEIFDFTIQVASGQLTLEETQAWFKANIVKK